MMNCFRVKLRVTYVGLFLKLKERKEKFKTFSGVFLYVKRWSKTTEHEH